MKSTTKYENKIKYTSADEVAGSEAILRTLVNENVDVIFGYPGGGNMPIYDSLYDHTDEIRHILSRHEQGSIHAAQGYARVSGKAGVVFATSGPGATNLVTGLADALADSTPLVCITGQVGSHLLGTDAFQEADVIGITLPVTKWNYRLTDEREIPRIISKAFYIANSGRPGPVLIDISKDSQFRKMKYYFEKCDSVKGYKPFKIPNKSELEKAAELINSCSNPFLIFGNGVNLSQADKELRNFVDKSGIPAAWTILGVSNLPTTHPLNMGMVGMHGNYITNKMINECDLLIAVGMRFDDRVTGDPRFFASNAKVLHIDIDPSEINKVVNTYHSILGDAKSVLPPLTELVKKRTFDNWINQFKSDEKLENKLVKEKDFYSKEKEITMAEVVKTLNEFTNGNAIITTDVGQHQMTVSRYIKIAEKGKLITSGGLGTMGFGLPSAIGAKLGMPNQEVIAIVGDGGIQMTFQELGTIMQENLNVKLLILNNEFLGMVRQWQELFFDKRYSFTEMKNPDFPVLASAFDIQSNKVEKREDLANAIETMLNHEGSYVLEVKVAKEGNVFPIIPSGKHVAETRFETV
jgi:acetolactate synthase-1/2/3 large subunit